MTFEHVLGIEVGNPKSGSILIIMFVVSFIMLLGKERSIKV